METKYKEQIITLGHSQHCQKSGLSKRPEILRYLIVHFNQFLLISMSNLSDPYRSTSKSFSSEYCFKTARSA